jgi:hypothetical protein
MNKGLFHAYVGICVCVYVPTGRWTYECGMYEVHDRIEDRALLW